MARFIRKRFPILFVATYFVVAASMIGFLIYPILFTEASLQVNFTNTGAATVTIGPSSSMTAVMNVVIPDAWNSGAYTADILMQNSGINYWQGSTLTAIPALGTTSGVGYKDAGAAGFQGGDTEAVIRDLDADSVYTSAADTLVDADGTATNTAGATALSGGDSLYDIVGEDNVVADSVVTPTNVWQDSDANLRYISNKSAEAAVAGGNGDIALSLTALTNPTVTLGGTANQWDAAEDVYIDVDTSLTVTTGDTRVTATAGGAVGSVVACPADADCLTVIEALTQGKVTGGDGIWAVGTEYVYDDINNSGANGVSAGDNRLTAIVAESVVLGTPTDGDTGTNVAATAGWVKEVNALWTPGNDLFIENVAGKFTYSASADVTVYVGGGVAAGDSLTDFVADCDGGGVGTQVCKFTGAGTIDATKSIYVDEGTAGGAAPNSVVDRQDDQLAGMGIQNTGTAVNSTDISSVTLWADDGDGIFQGVGVDTSLGAMTVNPGDSKEWRLSGLTQAIPIGGKRIFAAILTTITPTNGRTLKFQIPVYNDVGADGVASSAGDVGVFMSSTNDGPTDAVVLNANTQTIDSAGPVVTSRVTADADGDGQIDRIIFTTDEALNDNFTITLDVAVYAGEAYVTGGAANDNIFWVNFTESGSMDTGATPNTQLTVNTKLKDLYGNVIATDGAPVASTDGAAPILIGGSYRDIDGNGAIDTLRVTWSESVTMTGSTAVDWTIVGGDINATFSVATDSPGLGTDKDITVTADAGETNSATAPTIAYDNDDTNNSVVDAALNPAGTTGPATMIDLAAPAVLTATFYDASPATNDGKLDRITVVWSENISAVADGSADWAISSAANFAALTETAVICNSGAAAANECRYTFTTTTVKTNVGDLSLAYTAGTSVTDGTNTAASKTITSASSPAFTDGAAPVIKTITYQDVDLDGKIDRIIFDYSETVTASSVLRANDLVFGNVGSFTGAAFGANATDLITGAVTSTDVDLGTEATAVITNDTSSLLAVSTQNLFSLADGVPNTNTTLGNQSQATYVDGAAPAVVSTTFYDAMGSDGKLDLIGVIWSENISAVANGSADWALTSAANFAGIVEGTVECNSGSAAADECDYGFTTTTVKTNVGDLSLAYTAGTSVTDGTNTAASKTITSASSPAFTDSAAPVIVTTSPASAATDVALDASMVITFSEAMTQASVTGAITRLPSFTLGAAGWTSGDTVLTYAAHDAFAGMQIYTITLAGTIASAAAGDGNLAAGPVANPFSFTTVAAGGGGGGGGGGLPASVMVLSPNGGESWAGLSSKNITWSSTSTTITKVKIYYSLDRGVNFPYTIATNENNDGTYSWTVPNVPSSTVKIKVEGHDESGVFVASDISDADFTITYTTPPPPGAETPPSAENPAGLVAGDLFKSPLSTTVYYFGSDNKRHIFPNEKTYKSWYPDWSNVKSVTAEELRAIPLGKNVTVRPGTVLVKIDTNPKVYAVEPNGLLRWIPTETRIKTLYGGNWATKIIDVPLAFWGDYFFGSDISTDTHPTGALVQYSGTTDVYYIQGAEKRKVTAAGFTANNFRSENILAIPTTLSYANGADITGAEEMLMKIY